MGGSLNPPPPWVKVWVNCTLGGQGLSSIEISWKMQKQAITDINVPNGSRDIPFLSQEFEQDRRRHFVGF